MKYNPFLTIGKKKLALSVAASLALGSGFSNIALAQDDEEAVEQITVTGTRIRSDDFSNAQPSTVVGSDMLENLGMVNLGDAMASLPSNVSGNTPTANPGGNFFNGSNIANLRGLNPFFGSRTLTLVDSRRHVPTNQGDGVDLNFIPAILIDRMEVVTGGASASYGSGAIGGVTNILLDRDLEGGKVQLDYGITDHNDGEDIHIGAAWGTRIGDSAHLVVGFEGQDAGGIGSCIDSREWCANSVDRVTNAGFATNADPNFIVVDNVRVQNMNTQGMFPLLGVTFTDGSASAIRPYQGGNALGQGGEGRSQYQYSNLRSPVEREILYASFTGDISDDLSYFIEGSVGSVDTFTPQGSLDVNFQFVPADNYYLNNLAVNPCAGIEFLCFYNKDFSADLDTFNETSTDLERFAAGLSGRFGDTTWTWDAYYQHGKSDRSQLVNNNRRLEGFNFAFDAVPSIPGDYSSTPVCRIVRDGIPDGFVKDPRLVDGCAPVNIFGIGNMDAAGKAYAVGRLLELTTVKQDMFEGVASGEVFDGFGAGPVRAALGASFRDESIANISDPSQPDYIRRDYLIQYGETFAGKVEVLEYFAEATIPFTEDFDVQVAARRSEYTNTAGVGTPNPGDKYDYNITTWKATGNWQVMDLLRLRGSVSRDIRAPNFRELYYGQDLQRGGPFGFCSNLWTGNISQGFFTNTGDPCTIKLRGGLDVQPEKADTVTLGLVLTPEDWNVRFAADWFNIKIEDAITPANSGLVVQSCFDGDLEFCNQIEGTPFNPNDLTQGFSQIDALVPTARNFRGYEASGVDITADWIGEFNFGTISSRIIATRMLEQLIQPSETNPTKVDISNTYSTTSAFLDDWTAAPGWAAQWVNTLVAGPTTLTLAARWVSNGKIYSDAFGPDATQYSANAPLSINDNTYPNYVNWTLNAAYSFTAMNIDMQVFGNVDNLLDKDPPVVGEGVGGALARIHDTIGRSFRIGLRANF